ncbi:MAG: hypothetical protein U0136_14250 [Bdellovibrionota bacterium]
MKTASLWQAFCVLLFALTVGCKQGGGVIVQCGGAANFQCPAGLYCDLQQDCGGIDRQGVCRRMPADCEPGGQPVCGCNKKNFPNACYANASGVSIAYNGPCID